MEHPFLKASLQDGRPLSAPPLVQPVPKQISNILPHVHAIERAVSGDHFTTVSSQKENILAAHLDIMPALQRSVPSVVKSRNGSVLSRGFILKTDHYPSGELHSDLDGCSKEANTLLRVLRW